MDRKNELLSDEEASAVDGGFSLFGLLHKNRETTDDLTSDTLEFNGTPGQAVNLPMMSGQDIILSTLEKKDSPASVTKTGGPAKNYYI